MSCISSAEASNLFSQIEMQSGNQESTDEHCRPQTCCRLIYKCPSDAYLLHQWVLPTTRYATMFSIITDLVIFLSAFFVHLMGCPLHPAQRFHMQCPQQAWKLKLTSSKALVLFFHHTNRTKQYVQHIMSTNNLKPTKTKCKSTRPPKSFAAAQEGLH